MIRILGKDYKVIFRIGCYTLFIPDVCIIYITRCHSHSYTVRMFFYYSRSIFFEHFRSIKSTISYIQERVNNLGLSDIRVSSRYE